MARIAGVDIPNDKFEFVGLDNYIRMFKDPVFTKSLINTVILVIGSVPIVVLFSLFVASQTYHQNAIARSFYRFVFFLPVVTGSVAVTVVWKWIYDPLSGILNFVLKSSHIISQNISWLGDKNWALLAIMIILLTTSVGQPIILYIAAMGNIDNSLVEAARVDGATEFQVFWNTSDIVYTTNSVLGFDYLNDNLASTREGKFLPPFNYVIIDEIDDILLDSAQTPLIIAGSPRVQSNYYGMIDTLVTTLVEGVDYIYKEEKDQVWLTRKGAQTVETFLGHFY